MHFLPNQESGHYSKIEEQSQVCLLWLKRDVRLTVSQKKFHLSRVVVSFGSVVKTNVHVIRHFNPPPLFYFVFVHILVKKLRCWI